MIRSLTWNAGVLVAAFLTGCAIQRSGLVLDSVGPARQAKPQPSDSGSLTVYSAYDVNAHFYSRRYLGREYSDYQIFDSGGKLVQAVHNTTDTIVEEPATIELSPGSYHIVAHANGYGEVTVPITIELNKQTVVHLEGGSGWGKTAGLGTNDVVRLPDGQIVGYRSGFYTKPNINY